MTNLPRAITEDQLETIFGKYGRIVQKHILRDKSNGTPRGVAFVRYVHIEIVDSIQESVIEIIDTLYTFELKESIRVWFRMK